jgi:biopolymer transport protein TolR
MSLLRQSFTEDKPMSEINIVPYVDVMLVLLVIFMITAPLLTQGVQVDLPQAAASVIDKKQEEPLVVTVDKMGNYFLNIATNPTAPLMTKDLSLQVAAALKRNPDRQVLVRGDEQVPYGQVVSAMVVLQEAGVPNVGLVTSPMDED